MTSSSPSMGTAAQLAKPEYRNWLALGHALTTELCHGLRSFVKRQTETFFCKVKARMATFAPCSCVFVSKRRANQYHDMGICNWAKILQAHHQSGKPNWKQSDSSKWIDPMLGPWEIAKLYLPDLGGHAVASVEDMDITNLLNLMYWCTNFSVPQHLIKDVRDVRNEKWAHVTSLELSGADKQIAFDAIENLLHDPSLTHDPDAQNALKEIVKLKSVSDLHSMEAKVLADFREQQIELKHGQEILKKALDDINPNRFGSYDFFNSLILMLGTLFWVPVRVLSENVKGARKKDVVKWLVLLVLFHCCLVLDDSSNKEGCTMQEYDDPWQLKFLDFTDFIISSQKDFIGRRWLYKEMELALEHNDKRGVLLTGNPGSGKSAFLSHLLCSRTSSPVVHSRILAHHFCMHSNKKTQDGVSFVRNLANMIATEFSEYRRRILDDAFSRRVLYKDCSQDPEWCFEYAILRPLKKIRPQPRDSWYILVDALDECFNEKAEIFNILKSKARRLPKWLKVIVSSRNESTIVASLEVLQRIELRPDSKENLEDIDTYLTLKMFSQKESVVERFKTSLTIPDNDAPTQIMVSNLAKKGEGNFQYIKVVLDMWLTSGGNIDWETFPKTLENTYQLYFERKYAAPESFRPLREIFEVLVATHTPLSIKEMHSMFQIDNPTVDLEYDIMSKLSQVSLFLWHGPEGDRIRIHHASLAEWLTSDANKGKVFYVKKQNGHNRLARYYLKQAEESIFNPNQAFRLASHVVEGGLDKALVDQFLSLPSQNINSTDHLSQSTALHLSASSPNTNVTELLLQHFSNVDCLDNNRRTPSFVAAAAGKVRNLMVLFDRGAKLHVTTSYLDAEIASYSKDPVKACKKKKCGFSLLHAAAQEGNLDVVEYLLQHNISISKTCGSNNTAIQLAAENGHLEVVVMLKNAGGIPDGLSLHHSSFNGHTLVVKYLLNVGVKDTCIQGTPSPIAVTIADDKELNITPKVCVHDNYHLHSRETALHAAVRRGYPSVIKVLLTEDRNAINAINCTNSAGRFPQHEAVYLNRYNSLEALLQSGANASIQCHSRISAAIPQSQTPLPGTLQDRCPCGFSPLHLAAKYGYHSVAGLLLKYGADPNMGDCNGSTPLHIASCHGRSAIFSLLVDHGANIDAKSMNGSTPLHSAAVCLAKGSIVPLFELGCNCLVVDNEGMSALHYSVKDVDFIGKEFFFDSYARKPKDWIEEITRTPNQIMEIMNKLNVQYPWLSTLVELLIPSKKGLKSCTSLKDGRNETYFHKLEDKSNASSIFMGTNAIGSPSFAFFLTPVAFTLDTTFSEAIAAVPIKPGFIPKLFKGAFTKAAILMAGCSLLLRYVKDSFVQGVNIILNLGGDVNCYDYESGLTPMVVYLRTGGRHMSKVLAKHNVNVEITCGDPLKFSVLHMASYHKLHYLHYVHQFLMGEDNWEKYLMTEDAIFDYFIHSYEERNNSQGIMETLQIGDGPLTRAILSHPNGTKVVDECFDDEGFNSFHRAAQGANVVAIRKFLSWGADHSLESENGFSPLWLSVLYALKYRPYLNFERVGLLASLEIELASLTALEILDHGLQIEAFDVGCNESRSDLTLYHVAASRGMWKLVRHLLSSNKVTGIEVDCPNKHGITPLYLAKFIAEAHPPLLELSDEEIMSLSEKCGRHECEQYKISNNDLFKTSADIDKIQRESQKKVEKCYRPTKECPVEIKRNEVPHIVSALHILGKKWRTNLSFFNIRNNFISILESEMAVLKDLLNTATLRHMSHCIVHDKIRKRDRLHIFYREYKEKFDLLLEHSDEVKSLLRLNGKLPRYLEKVYFALLSFDSKLNCDWQAIATKYIQLSFQFHNLNIFAESLQKDLTATIVSDFAVKRMLNVSLQSSEESRQLMIKLTSRKPVKEFTYLRILQFRQPPFWSDI
ncbi:Ankyrin repeat domain-containing protein 50 [Acropora cervicornis]|uniref:Ankyrin repeat domain-containing protein 50 n=1 Tax=Acropora cervicornis TaxID=6130 RepID=A0AAD9QRH0_ACRCE|nr:Ankyrin repeat domain-containing protein 50 [Acropora cervicornis]